MVTQVNRNLVLGISGIEETDPPPEETLFLTQVHGTNIRHDPLQGAEADGMVCSRGNGFPGLKVADCLPVFAIWNSFTGAAHAGWRGLSAGIVEKLILSVDEPLEVLILGPCICADCYTVGEEVREAVAHGDPGGMESHPKGRVDLRRSALRRARKVSPTDFRVIDLDLCTLESERLYSYRENGTEHRNLLWLAETCPCLHIQHPYNESLFDPPRGE